MDVVENYDVVVIGGGPIGLACGIEAHKAGLSYVIIEKGCLVNSLFNYPVNMTFFSTSDKLEIGGVPFISHNPKPVRSEALEYYRRVQSSWNLNVRLFETVLQVNKTTTSNIQYKVETSKNNYLTKNIIVATGFYDIPKLMNVVGEDLPKVKHYYDDPHLYANQNVLVVGAQNSAVDVALETYRKGANVTMVVKGEEVGKRVKYWVKPDIENRIKEGAIKAYFNSTIKEIRPWEVDIQTPDGEVTLSNDFVLAMTGYHPDFSFLEKIGIKLAPDETKIPQHTVGTMETNLENIYLAGVVCGGMQTSKWFIENSREHAEITIRNIVSK